MQFDLEAHYQAALNDDPTDQGNQQMVVSDLQDALPLSSKLKDPILLLGNTSSPKATPIKKKAKKKPNKKPRVDVHEETATQDKGTEVQKIASSTGERKLITPLVLSSSFLYENHLGELWKLIKFQGWEELCSKPVTVDLDQVRFFYASFSLSDDGLTGHIIVNGDKFPFCEVIIRR